MVLPGNKDYRVGDLDPEAAGRRGRRRRRAGERRWRGPGRFRLHAVEGRVPRAVLRGPEAPQPDQDAHQGPEDAGAAARRLHDRWSAGQAQSRRAPCAVSWRAGSRCGGPRTADVLLLEKMLAEAESDTPRDDVRDRRAADAARAAAAVAPHDRLCRPDRPPVQPHSSACRSRRPQAVMFCLMDASASMTEQLKDLAKRFFMLLHVFLSRHYREVDVVFIRHTSHRERGRRGDVFPRRRDRRHGDLDGARGDGPHRPGRATRRRTGISTPRKPPTATTSPTTWAAACELVEHNLLPACQYFAYIEVSEQIGLR